MKKDFYDLVKSAYDASKFISEERSSICPLCKEVLKNDLIIAKAIIVFALIALIALIDLNDFEEEKK